MNPTRSLATLALLTTFAVPAAAQDPPTAARRGSLVDVIDPVAHAPPPSREVRAPVPDGAADARLLRRGSSGPEVTDLQRRLGVEPTGLLGETTERALRAWQAAHGLAADGVVGPLTRAALGRLADAPAPPPPGPRLLARGSHGPDVAELQRRLGVEPTGIFGETTERRLRGWQASQGLDADGVAGPRTRAALASSPSAPGPAREPAALAGARTSQADAWRGGRRLGPIEVVVIDGKPVAVDTARAFLSMRDEARASGVELRVVSGFRSNAEQQALYELYLAGRGNRASPAGWSNHQDGLALDLNTEGPGVHAWLKRNGARHGFVDTEADEPWHWELRR